MTSSEQRLNVRHDMQNVNPNYVGTLHDGECFANIILLIKFAGKSWGPGCVCSK